VPPRRSASPPATPAADEAREVPSKTRRKREMHELQQLGAALVALDPTRLASIALPEQLTEAIRFAQTLRAHEARRRQMQYIGRLMRNVDDAPIRDALARFAEGPARERARFARIERWRERILDEVNGLQAFVDTHPAASHERLAQLALAARDERANNARPHSYRALFRELERLLDDAHR
jgi:ribosome-associated protein